MKKRRKFNERKLTFLQKNAIDDLFVQSVEFGPRVAYTAVNVNFCTPLLLDDLPCSRQFF